MFPWVSYGAGPLIFQHRAHYITMMSEVPPRCCGKFCKSIYLNIAEHVRIYLFNSSFLRNLSNPSVLHKLQNIYTVIHIQNIHEHVGHLLNLRQGECKKQQQDGDDNADGIFLSSCSPALCRLKTLWRTSSPTAWSVMMCWTQQSLVSYCFSSPSHILSISFSCDQTSARSSL